MVTSGICFNRYMTLVDVSFDNLIEIFREACDCSLWTAFMGDHVPNYRERTLAAVQHRGRWQMSAEAVSVLQTPPCSASSKTTFA